MAARDRVVLGVLATGVVVALLSWHFLGYWLGLAAGVIALVVACVVYRIEAPRIDLDDPERWGTQRAEPAPRVDQ